MAPLPGCRGPLGGGISPVTQRGGCGAAIPLAGLRLSVGRGRRGWRRGEEGGFPLSLSGPLVLLPGGCGGAAWWSGLRGASR